MDQNALVLTSSANPCGGSGLPTFLDSPTASTPHTRQSPMEPNEDCMGKGDAAAADATNPIGYPTERYLQPMQHKDALPEVLEARQQRLLRTVDGSSIVEYRRAVRPRKRSVYSGLAPPSQSSKKQLGAADEQLFKRRLGSNKSITSSASQYYSAAGASSGAVSRIRGCDSSMSLSAYKGTHLQSAVEDLDADLALTASFIATVDSREPSAVLLQAIDTLQALSPLKGSGLRSGGSDGSKSCSRATNDPNAAAAAAAERGPPSRRKSVSHSSEPNSRDTGTATARPSVKGSSGGTVRSRGVVSFRRKSDGRLSCSGNRLDSSVRDTGNVAKAEEVHHPIRRLSSSRNLPIIWIPPPLKLKRQKSSRALRPTSRARPQSSRAPSAEPPVVLARTAPLRPPSTSTLPRRQENVHARTLMRLTSSSISHEVEKRGEERGAQEHHHGDVGGHPVPALGQASQLPELGARYSLSTLSQRTAPHAALRCPAAAYHRSSGGSVTEPSSIPPLSVPAFSVSDRHPYYVTADGQQPVPYPATDALSEYARDGVEDFPSAPGHAKPPTVRRAGSLTRRRWAPAPPTGCEVVVELLSPLTAGSASSTPPRQPQRPQEYLYRSPQEPTVELFGRGRPRRIKAAGMAKVSAREDASSTQLMRCHAQLPGRAKAAIPGSQHEDVALLDLDEGEGCAAARSHTSGPPLRRSPAADGPYVSRHQRRKRSVARKTLEQNMRLHHMFSPYMSGWQTGPGAGRRARVARRRKDKSSGRSEQHRGSGAVQGHEKPIDYAALATERDPLDHLLGRHGFWGEAMTRC
ncbi:hypothetical protein LSCM1_01495 [Leishmania martiniquensis]|uniref:Uncharacterized protein n=1 Tax=Leishmania martiniquensis TaxID=1580590 RepID=A0A836KCL1_9TRYP|nr:hypothetical protein LSCM1_01495 [Leishmania martiniquensis]